MYLSEKSKHHYQDLITVFHDCFFQKYNTILVKGGEEPLYLPANNNQCSHVIFFAHGFFSSALHECAHWLIAGSERRKLEDYGYWYAPDGRTPEQQILFQSVEIKPQAIEWILAVAAGHCFRVSLDNLDGMNNQSAENFEEAVYQQVLSYCEQGLPLRARVFRKALCRFYATPEIISPEHFKREI